METTHRTDHAEPTLADHHTQPAAAAWPEHYRDAARAIDAERTKTPHDAPLYWSYFPGTD